jgi:hypothetical protein
MHECGSLQSVIGPLMPKPRRGNSLARHNTSGTSFSAATRSPSASLLSRDVTSAGEKFTESSLMRGGKIKKFYFCFEKFKPISQECPFFIGNVASAK